MRAILRTIIFLVISLPVWALGLGDLTDGEASGGLKEALTQGATQAVSLLGKPDGFLKNKKVRIPLPDGLAQAEPVLRGMGQGQALDDLVTAMNRAAEQAVPAGRALLVDAVRHIGVSDALRIVRGGSTSVTDFFVTRTREPLAGKFLPIVSAATKKVKLAERYHALAAKAAGFGLLRQEDVRLEPYVTGKALDGLYFMIAEEERKIRADPLRTGSRILQAVFGR